MLSINFDKKASTLSIAQEELDIINAVDIFKMERRS